jgi:hypothetical protein
MDQEPRLVVSVIGVAADVRTPIDEEDALVPL